MSISIMFWFNLILALLNGQVVISEASSITSENLVPDHSIRMEWPCGQETCFLDLSNLNTGP